MNEFKGTSDYIAGEDLQVAVNAAIHLQKPLLVKGEPGTGKTMLAEEISKALNKKMFSWHIKSTTKAQQGLYEYDAVSRLRDSQLGDEKVHDIENYIKRGPFWHAIEEENSPVLLIDEIDKADIDFPNDLLLELDKMTFYCYELQRKIEAKSRPVVIITSNNEKELPDAFLRRCIFHYIQFPDKETMKEIVDVHFKDLDQKLFNEAMQMFYNLRELNALKKKPSTSELIDWINLLILGNVSPKVLEKHNQNEEIPPFAGALLKNEQDIELFNQIKYQQRF